MEFEKFKQEEPIGRREGRCQDCVRRVEAPGKDIVRVFELNGQELVEAEEKRVARDSASESEPERPK